MPSRTVLEALHKNGEFVKSASSTVERPVADRLRAQGLKALAPVRNQARTEAAALFGVPAASIRVPRQRGAERAPKPPPADAWALAMFDRAEKQAWRAAGLGAHDARIAERCRGEGLTPDDLAIRVDGVKAAARLRGGESVTSVRVRLAEKRQRDAGAG